MGRTTSTTHPGLFHISTTTTHSDMKAVQLIKGSLLVFSNKNPRAVLRYYPVGFLFAKA